MRILHLLDVSSGSDLPEGAATAIALLQRRDTDNAHRLVFLGPAGAADRVRHFGATVDARTGASTGRKRSALRGLDPILRRLGRFDAVQPWSQRTRTVAHAIRGGVRTLPPAPPGAPIDPALLGATARARWRRRFNLGDSEIALALLDQDPERSSAGAFGLTIAPLSCSIQDRTIVGLIPESSISDGAIRAARYAASASDVWRIECLSAPGYAVAIASDAVLCPTSPSPDDPWARFSSSALALRCALAMTIPVVTGAFDESLGRAPYVAGGHAPQRPGRVGIVTALNETLPGSRQPTKQPIGVRRGDNPEGEARRWLEQWRTISRVQERTG
jgi:hypothetical protein